MLSFKQFILERLVDPEFLAKRTSQIYGKKTSYGKWLKTEKGGHIPLTSYRGREVSGVQNRLFHVQGKMGMHDDDPNKQIAGLEKYKSSFKPRKMEIKHLNATQPFVRTQDSEKLKNKISGKSSSKVIVIQHKDKHYIQDGHHTVMAAKLRGEKHIDVHHINLNEH
jgi:hypothetical protein